jgi:hypothetical protein
MNRQSRLSTQCINLKLLTSCTVSLWLSLIPATLADYVPPENQEEPSDYSKSGGIRGPEQIPLTILAPQTYVGYTTSQSPTFVWFVPNLVDHNSCGNEEINPEIEFRLYEYEADGQPKAIGETILLPAKSGIMSLPFPEKQPELAIGQTYFWQVTMLCQAPETFTNEEELYLTAVDFKVVDVPANVKANLSSSLSPFEQAEIYAESGLWYDALTQALSLTDPGKLGELGATYLEDLANSENIGENEPDSYEIKNRNEHLREIATQAK